VARNRRPARSPYRERELLRRIAPQEPASAFRPGEPMLVHHVRTGSDLLALDHVALAVADPAAMAAFLCDHVGMHELGCDPEGTVLGAAPGAATLTLAAAPGPREPGALGRLVLRVPDVERAIAALPAGTEVAGDRFERAEFEGPEGLGIGFTVVAGGGIDYDLDHVVLRVGDPEGTRVALAELGFVPRARALHIADKYVTLAASPTATERPLLGHLGVRVESVEAVAELASARGLAIEADGAPDALTVVLAGPEALRVRFVERARPAQP
jgi:catechol 2,3-dioxygenase-like lactoylglutathione lyase family enzyme